MKKQFFATLMCLGFAFALVSPVATFAEELAISQDTIYENNTMDVQLDGNIARASSSDAEITSGSETWIQPYLGTDLSIWKRDNSQIFSGIMVDSGGRLIAGTDYDVIPGTGGSTEDEVRITSRYLKPFLGKTLTLTFEYEAGANPTVQVHVEAPEKFPIVDGAGSVWQQGDKNALSFTTDTAALPVSCVGVEVDGAILSSSKFAVSGENGNTVQLTPAYLAVLSPGGHRIRILFNERSSTDPEFPPDPSYLAYSETTFTIEVAPTEPAPTEPAPTEPAPTEPEPRPYTDSDSDSYIPKVAPAPMVAPIIIETQVLPSVAVEPEIPAPLPRTGETNHASGLWLLFLGLSLGGLVVEFIVRRKKTR